jgi:catechol 2,3-dioxygenase-like lactoylglutathione lyase family enzyme
MPLAIAGFDHVQITVPKVLEAECLAFYRGLFGFREIAKPEELRARGGVWFEVVPAGMQMHIGFDAEPSPRSKRHICFLVEDLAVARAQVESRGVPIEEEGMAEGLSRFFIRDPAGNRIEIGQRI